MPHPRHHFAAFNREIDEIYFHVAIKAFAMSLVGIFVPIYILQHTSLSEVLLFYVVLLGSLGIVSPLGAIVQNKLGSKHTILLSMPFFALGYFLLFAFATVAIPVLAIGLVFGIAEAFYWMSFHVDFSISSNKWHRSEQLGYLNAIPLFVASFAPLIGGLVAVLAFPMLFAIASFLLLFSAIPLFFSKEIRRRPRMNVRLFRKEISLRSGLAFFASGFKMIGGYVLWPIFMFLIVRELLTLGALAFIGSILTAIVVIATGKLTRRIGTRKSLRISSVLDAVSWPVRTFAQAVDHLFVASGLAGITGAAQHIPYESIMYDKSKRRAEYFVFREFWLAAGRVSALFLVYLLLDSGAGLLTGLWLSSAAALAMMLI